MNMGRPGGLFHLRAAGTGLPVGNVVLNRVIEQHSVLGNDANGLAHRGLGNLLDVLCIQQDAPLLNIIKTEQQARQRRLARTRWPNHRDGFSAGNLKADVLQNRPCRVVSEMHLLKAHMASPHRQGRRAGAVGNLSLALHQREHFLQVGQALLDLAVQHAQETQRYVQLNHEGVDHDQVAQRHAPVHHALGRPPQHGHQADGDDQLLPRVEQAQRGLALDRGTAVALQVFVIAPSLKLFIVEVLDGFVVEQRVNRPAVGSRVELVHSFAKLGAPLGHGNREADVEHQRYHGDPGKPDIKLDRQQREHQRDLDQGRDDAVERVRNQRMHGAGTTLDVACHAAGLALQVKAQAQGMQMAKHLQRDAACCALGGLGENQVAQFGKQCGRQAQQAVGQQQRRWHHQQRCCQHAAGGVHGVNQLLEQQRHTHIGHFGSNHKGQCRQHPPFVLP